MDYEITFTLNQLILFITTIGGVITMVAAVTTIIFKLVNKAKAPEVEQNRRIKALEDRLKIVEDQNKIFTQYFINDDKRFKEIENANRIIQSSILALLQHAINGDDIEILKKAEERLKDYLVEK